MLYSICCNEAIGRPEYNICPACGEHCNFESYDEREERLSDEATEILIDQSKINEHA